MLATSQGSANAVLEVWDAINKELAPLVDGPAPTGILFAIDEGDDASDEAFDRILAELKSSSAQEKIDEFLKALAEKQSEDEDPWTFNKSFLMRCGALAIEPASLMDLAQLSLDETPAWAMTLPTRDASEAAIWDMVEDHLEAQGKSPPNFLLRALGSGAISEAIEELQGQHARFYLDLAYGHLSEEERERIIGEL